MSLAETLDLDRLVWADLTADEKRNAVADQLVEGRGPQEAADMLSIIYGPVGVKQIRRLIHVYELYQDPAIREAVRLQQAKDLRARAARARAREAGRETERLTGKLLALPSVPLPDPADHRRTVNIGVMEIKASQCHFPKWGADTPSEQRFYCGQPVREGSAYCGHCHKRVYRPAGGEPGADTGKAGRPRQVFYAPGKTGFSS